MDNIEQNNSPKTETPSPNVSPESPSPEVKKNNPPSISSLIIIIVVIVIIIIAGLYMWGSQLSNNRDVDENQSLSSNETADSVSQSDDLNIIENEASATRVDDSSSIDFSFDEEI